ncbi:ABC transporter substrate-binding protein [Pelagibacteraceae bacterium]|nr:ABC transporter substrate-binding protein [Pelagibacteraceae bacterium]MDC3178546.1 ABC transporter substrate-binding protein [Pelagibacteraceae bacterium]
MKKFFSILLTIFVPLSFTNASKAAGHMEAEVIHWWTSGGEQAAISQFAEAWQEMGNTWIDTAITGGDNARGTTVNRIIGGNPPTAAQFNISKQFVDLVEQGLLQSLEEVASAEGWRDFIYPPELIETCEFEGEFYCVPVNIHSWQWMWINNDVYKQVGLPVPQTFEEFLAGAPTIQAAGIIPLALGGQGWQESGMFDVVASSIMGFPLMRSVYRDKDLDAFRDGRFESVLNTYRELNQFTDEGSPGRLWNDTTAMVIEGKAAMQVMGDWARGEFAVAGMEAMKDYSCVIPGKEKYVALGGDVFVFPKNDDPKVKDTQLAMASMMVNPTVQAKFNNAKGSLPMRLDVDTSAADACMQMGLDLIQNPDAIMRESDDWNTPAFTAAWGDIISEFRNDPNYTVAQAMDDLEGVLTSGL